MTTARPKPETAAPLPQKLPVSDADIYHAAQAICQERCAYMGEPPCWQITDDNGEHLPWPPEACNDPGCLVMAEIALRYFAERTYI